LLISWPSGSRVTVFSHSSAAQSVINNSLVHALAATALFALGLFISSDSQLLTLTVGGILTGLYYVLNRYAG
jgi:uncharacterized membrane protein YpjA